jgi:hypothetical protein
MAPSGQRHTFLVASVGTRDVALDIGDRERPWWVALDNRQDGRWAQEFLGSGAGTRAMAAALRARFEELADRLALPILGPSLDLALEKLDGLDCVVLFATDQPVDAGPHRDWDTIESARLIAADPSNVYDAISLAILEVFESLGAPALAEAHRP